MVQGDHSLIEEIFVEYHPQLQQFGTRIVTDNYIVEESIQETFIYLYEKKIDLRSISNLKAYLFTAFRRRLLDKKKKSASTDTLAIDGTDIRFTERDFIEREMVLSSDQVKSQMLHNLLNDLPWRQREAIYLKYFNNLKGKEIAEIMGIQPQVVANTIYKALKTLRSKSQKAFE